MDNVKKSRDSQRINQAKAGLMASGCRLKEFRREAKLSQELVSARAGISIGSLRHYECGIDLRLSTAVAIANALGRKASEIWPGLEGQSPKGRA